MIKIKLQRLLSIQGLWAAQSGRKLLSQIRRTVPGLPCTALLQIAVPTPLEIEPKLLPFKRREPRCRRSCGFLNLVTITYSLAATEASSALSLRWDQHLPTFKRFQNESDTWSSLGARELSNGLKGQSLLQLVLGPHQPSSNTVTPPRSSWHPLLVLKFGSQSHSTPNSLHSVRSDERHAFTIFGSIQIKWFPIPQVSVTSVPRE